MTGASFMTRLEHPMLARSSFCTAEGQLPANCLPTSVTLLPACERGSFFLPITAPDDYPHTPHSFSPVFCFCPAFLDPRGKGVAGFLA